MLCFAFSLMVNFEVLLNSTLRHMTNICELLRTRVKFLYFQELSLLSSKQIGENVLKYDLVPQW